MNNQAFTIKKGMSMPVQMSPAQDGKRPKVDDQRLDLADDLKEAQDHISSTITSHKTKITTSMSIVLLVDLVRGQLRRAMERYGRPLNLDKEVRPVEETVNVNNREVEIKVETLLKEYVSEGDNQNEMGYQMESSKSLLKITDVNSEELMRDPVIVSTTYVKRGFQPERLAHVWHGYAVSSLMDTAYWLSE
ncbi:hypothetical protein Tco_0786302 [Tanacetum coccineum]